MCDNVISFDKPASFWLEKAHKCARKIEWREAVRYYLLALEKEDSLDTAAELALAYVRLACYETADRILFNVFLKSPSFGKAFYVTGLSAYYQGHEDLSMAALDKFLRLCPKSPVAQEVHDLLAETSWTAPACPEKRGWRSQVLCSQAKSCTDRKKQNLLLHKAVKLDPGGQSLLTACLFSLSVSPSYSLILWKKAVRKGIPSYQKLACCLTGSLIYMLLKNKDLCARCLKKAPLFIKTRDEEEWFCATCFHCGQWHLAEEFALDKLKIYPCDTSRMHIVRLSRLLQGKNSEAEEWKNLILSIDPGDPCVSHNAENAIPYFSYEKKMIQAALRLLSVREERLRPGTLNRLTHVLCLALRDHVSVEDVFRFVPPMYRGLRPLVREKIEGSASQEWHLAFTLCLLKMKHQTRYAHDLFMASPRKQRLLRCMGRIERGMKNVRPVPHIIK